MIAAYCSFAENPIKIYLLDDSSVEMKQEDALKIDRSKILIRPADPCSRKRQRFYPLTAPRANLRAREVRGSGQTVLLSQRKLNSWSGLVSSSPSPSFADDDRASGTEQTPPKRRESTSASAREGQETALYETKCSVWPSTIIRDKYTHTHTRTGIELIYPRAGRIRPGRSSTRTRYTRAHARAPIRDSNSGVICNGMKYASLSV